MPQKPDADPAPGHVDAVVTTVLQELLTQIATEVGHPLVLTLEVMRDHALLFTRTPIPSVLSAAPTAQIGFARLRFRDTFFPNRQLFLHDAVLGPDLRTPSFSGFRVRGRVTSEDGKAIADYSTWAMKYNDFDWVTWF